MRESELSSGWTFWTKFILPVIWISGFGLGTVAIWFDDFHGLGNEPPPLAMKFWFLGLSLAGSSFLLWSCAGLKRVRVKQRQLVISNYIREICVPLTAVRDVSQNRWLNGRPVTIYLRGATAFGDRVTFMPKHYVVFRFWRVDPIVDELKQAAGLLHDP
jgi:hypothetical protein